MRERFHVLNEAEWEARYALRAGEPPENMLDRVSARYSLDAAERAQIEERLHHKHGERSSVAVRV